MSEQDIEIKETEEKDPLADIEKPSGSKNFIAIWDNALTPEVCSEFIEMFESEKEHHEKVAFEWGDGMAKFTALRLNNEAMAQNNKRWVDLSVIALEAVQKYTEYYRRVYNIAYFPEQCVNEHLIIRKFDPTDEYMYHADVIDPASSLRFLGTQFYLNDLEGPKEDKDNGELVFPDYKLAVSPKEGRLLIYPPFWTHPYQELSPKESPKYVLGTYLTYAGNLGKRTEEAIEREAKKKDLPSAVDDAADVMSKA